MMKWDHKVSGGQPKDLKNPFVCCPLCDFSGVLMNNTIFCSKFAVSRVSFYIHFSISSASRSFLFLMLFNSLNLNILTKSVKDNVNLYYLFVHLFFLFHEDPLIREDFIFVFKSNEKTDIINSLFCSSNRNIKQLIVFLEIIFIYSKRF